MRTIRYTNRFKLDYRREQSGKHSKKKLGTLFETFLNLLAEDKPLPPNAADHALREMFCDSRD